MEQPDVFAQSAGPHALYDGCAVTLRARAGEDEQQGYRRIAVDEPLEYVQQDRQIALESRQIAQVEKNERLPIDPKPTPGLLLWRRAKEVCVDAKGQHIDAAREGEARVEFAVDRIGHAGENLPHSALTRLAGAQDRIRRVGAGHEQPKHAVVQKAVRAEAVLETYHREQPVRIALPYFDTLRREPAKIDPNIRSQTIQAVARQFCDGLRQKTLCREAGRKRLEPFPGARQLLRLDIESKATGLGVPEESQLEIVHSHAFTADLRRRGEVALRGDGLPHIAVALPGDLVQ